MKVSLRSVSTMILEVKCGATYFTLKNYELGTAALRFTKSSNQ